MILLTFDKHFEIMKKKQQQQKTKQNKNTKNKYICKEPCSAKQWWHIGIAWNIQSVSL